MCLCLRWSFYKQGNFCFRRVPARGGSNLVKVVGFSQTAGAVPIAAAPSVRGLPKRRGSIDLAETLRTVLASLAARAHETYDEIIAILKSQHRVKSIPLEIDATFWGEEYAAEAPAGRSRRTVC